jgi:multidrug transporter EmrE-like cation transporter
MSNMVVIPQLILLVAMINIFSYNSFQTHVSFVWWISLAVIFTGIILLSIFFVRALQKMSAKTK